MTDPAGIPALIDAIRHLYGAEARHADRTRAVRRSGARRLSPRAAILSSCPLLS